VFIFKVTEPSSIPYRTPPGRGLSVIEDDDFIQKTVKICSLLLNKTPQASARRVQQSSNDCNGCGCESPSDIDVCDCRASQLGCSHPARSPLGDPKRNELCVRRLHQYEVVAKDHAQQGKEAANRTQLSARFQAVWRHQEPRQTIRPSPNIASSSLLLMLSCPKSARCFHILTA